MTTTILPSFWKTVLALLLAALLAACSSDPKPPPLLTFNVRANVQANNGDLFYFVVRNVNEKQFMLDSYQDIADKAFASPADPAVLGVFSIVPGTKQECAVNQPAQGSVGLYFLYTRPGSQWKKLLSMPFDLKYTVNLKSDNQIEILETRPWYSWF
ncbi:MAG: hypothetical protein U1D70_18470 [Methylobacter sp.]|nr:hypothetical protein [Methylobacter sp.]MDP2429926.1 hypothetical protein [Methylobacter sp.]MDP3053189.1 hypothetical protein [Methylobacter sp.]MDP3360574.1 hypothetical protein [Methylobacter sp.]MDZ4220996.1 hypothetical protein [Methylobacter sp.]